MTSKQIHLAILGDSHLGALKYGWDALSEAFPHVSVTFFGAAKDAMRNVKLEGRSILPQTPGLAAAFRRSSGGKEAIELDDYDLFVVHGAGLSLHRFLRTEIILKKKKVDRDAAGAFAAFLEGSIARLYAELLTRCNQEFLLSPAPYTSEKAARRPNWLAMQNLLKTGPNSSVKQLITVLDQFLFRFESVPQPTSTIEKGMFTKRAYGSQVRQFADGNEIFKAEDIAHANEDYGALVMRELIARADQILQGQGASPLARENLGQEAAADEAKSAAKAHPYRDLPAHCFWTRTALHRAPEEIGHWYRKKFEIQDLRVATAGSCFAQHIGRRMRTSGFQFLDMEPAPSDLPASEHARNGYGLYSARYGNVYTPRQLLQLVQRATGKFKPKVKAWDHQGGFVDPFRPNIPERPYESVDALVAAQEAHLCAVRDLLEQTDLFVFTLGLTEGWQEKADGAVYPLAPGVSGGSFDPSEHAFVNFDYEDVLGDMKSFISLARELQPRMKFLLTVSPVPLMATARADTQVVVATSESKAILRAAAGALASNDPDIDYFPSYEIINSHVMCGMFYEDDLRGVREVGVDHVMKQFFSEHRQPEPSGHTPIPLDEDELFCDEELLDAFSKS